MEAELLDLFTHGYCYEFAIALNKITQLPLMQVVVVRNFPRITQTAHAFVKSGTSKGIDARGEQTYSQIKQAQEQEISLPTGYRYEIKPATERILRLATGRDFDPYYLEKAEQYIFGHHIGKLYEMVRI